MKKFRIITILFLVLIFTSIAFGEDYFLYDLEMNKILYMGQNDTAFAEKLDMEKNPNLMMKTPDPNKYLAIYAPSISYDKKWFKKQINLDRSVAGQLIVFNIATGRTEELINIGYYPFRWAYSQDHRHFFISYKTTPEGPQSNLLHYDFVEGKSEVMTDIKGDIEDLTLSVDEKKLFVVNDQGTQSQLITLEFGPFAIEHTMPTGGNPKRTFAMSDDRLALFSSDWSQNQDLKEGLVRLINLTDYSIVEEQKTKPMFSYYQWFEKEKTLIVACGQAKFGFFGMYGKGEFFKVTAQGIKYYDAKSPWLDFHYSPEKDTLYVLNESNMDVINYSLSPVRVKTGNNTFSNSNYLYFYQFNPLPNPDYMSIYCAHNGHIKFFDTNRNKMVEDLKCGRAGRRFFSGLFEIDAEASIATSPDNSKYYILNQATQDITVLNDSFKKLNYLVPDEDPIGMFQVEKPNLNILLVTKKKIYRINCDNSTFQPIHEFKEESRNAYMLEDNNRLILLTDKELLVIDSASLEVKNRFFLFGNPDDKYTRVKKGEQRYYFIRSL